MSEDRSRTHPTDGPSAAESQEAMEKRVRKVRHLDPFTITCHADGRFSAQLEQAPGELKPETARAILEKLEVVLEPLREAAGRSGRRSGSHGES